jgi:YD repeat-containing protein
MRRSLQLSAICAVLALVAVSTFAQTGPMRGTVIDVDEGRGRLQIESDEDRTRTTVEMDAVSTVYYGFGSVIAGKPEIFTGSSGLSNVRLGDRVEIRGTERGQGVWKADRVTLLGRDVAASSVGVGTTRTPTSSATPVDDRATSTPESQTGGNVEGTIRTINEGEGRLVIQTPQRRMITVRTYRNTPVLYQGQTYQVSNLEVGDRIRVEAEARSAQADEINARRITVVQSVQDTGTAPTGGRVTTISGRVSRVEPGLDRMYVEDGREEIRIDMAQAEDAAGEVIHARDLRVGDMVEITGSYNRVGDMFNASTLRFTEADRTFPGDDSGAFDRPALVTTGGTVTESLEDAVTLGLRETDTNRVVRIWVAPDFVVKTKAGTYVLASTLRERDQVIVQTYRDARGNLIAQTIRLRNR